MGIMIEHYKTEVAIQTSYNLFTYPVVVRDTDIPDLIKELEVQLNKERMLSGISFEKIRMVERHARVGSPLMQLFNERWASVNPKDEGYREAATRVQAISQELLDLIEKGLL